MSEFELAVKDIAKQMIPGCSVKFSPPRDGLPRGFIDVTFTAPIYTHFGETSDEALVTVQMAAFSLEAMLIAYAHQIGKAAMKHCNGGSPCT